MRKHYHSNAFPASDVDLFLYGLTPEQAEVKINAIYEAVRDSVPWDVTCVRTKHTVSIHSQYPYRAVQIVLRLYQSPAEVLAGFDVDAPCCAYDGERVWANPRAIVAMMRQCNTTDITRRSPSYEVRLAKYAKRGFEIYVPQLKRDDIDPTIFERSINRVQGLARLLVLETLADADTREEYVKSRRSLRGRPDKANAWNRRSKKKTYRGDLKNDADSGIELSEYDILSLHIPYGPGWDARRVEKLVYQTDLGMNSPYNPKNKKRRLHRHPAFFGTMPECLEDCCEHCVIPKNDEERALQEGEDKSYVRGRIQFIVEDPGRQSISGSFNPIDEGEWTEQAYMGPTEKLFAAIAAHDRSTVSTLLQQGIDVNRRDHVGRTPLQVAVLSKAVDIASDLLDANARMTARLVDGRTALHLAAQLDLPVVVRKLLERSAVNAEAVKAAEEAAARTKDSDNSDHPMDTEEDQGGNEDTDMHDSSEDDWSSIGDNASTGKADKEKEANGDNILEGEEEEPDVFEVDVQDWDYSLSPLHYAIAAGSPHALDFLLAAGADVKLVAKVPQLYGHKHAHPLMLTAVAEDEAVACGLVEKLLAAGAFSSEADDNLFTHFHRMINLRKPAIVATLLRCDPKAKAALDVPVMPSSYQPVVFPIVSAIRSGSYSVLAVLLAHGAKLSITKDDFEKAREMKVRNNQFAPSDHDFPSKVPVPLEVALAYRDPVVHLLVALNAEVNDPIRDTVLGSRVTYLDFARLVKKKVADYKTFWLSPPDSANPQNPRDDPKGASPPEFPAWKEEVLKTLAACREIQTDHSRKIASGFGVSIQKVFVDEIKTYYDDVESLLMESGAKTGEEIYNHTTVQKADRDKNIISYVQDVPGQYRSSIRIFGDTESKFYRHTKSSAQTVMHTDLVALYDELFAACYAGDNAKIQQLCMPPQGAPKIPDTPLQISAHWGNQFMSITPLYLAILARKWDTLKLILAIATAQYSPDEPTEKAEPNRVSLQDGDSDNSDDSELEDEDAGDDDEAPINFIDVAKRHSEIRVQVSPSYMLNRVAAPYVRKGGDSIDYVQPIVQAIIEDDFEVFMQLYNIADSLPVNIYKGSLLSQLMNYDRPVMLDEYIRRTGEGILIQDDNESTDGDATSRGSRREYLGLNVHGKKRKDLASRGVPQSHRTYDGEPLLWIAVKNGLTATVKYLASEQPLAAYRFYASSHSDRQAKLLRQVPDLEASMPALLGWTASNSNETVLTAAIVHDRVEIAEMLFTLRPAEMRSFLHLRNRVHGFNNIHAAARWACKPALLDRLIAEGVSPMEADNEGRNIYHILCSFTDKPHIELLEHVIQHLPKDVTQTLLRNQFKRTGDTPLHLAIHSGSLRIVRLITQVDAAQYLIRNAQGSIPLHLAVDKMNSGIARLVAQAGPVEAILLEDAVGNTTLETATQLAFRDKLRKVCDANYSAPDSLRPYWTLKPFDLSQQKKELASFETTIQALVAEGRLTNGTKLHKELIAFAQRLAGLIAVERALPSNKKEDSEVDDCEADRAETPASATLAILTSVLKNAVLMRRLVHLSDVHRSVQATLNRVAGKESSITPGDEEEEEEEGPQLVLCGNYAIGLLSGL